MTSELGKQYDPTTLEKKWYGHWEEKGFFQPDPDAKGPAYTIVIPPPNVTGRLHMGHALNSSLQDVLIRWKRMSGCKTLWLPGTDHAGIATQNRVEKELRKEGIDRRDMGREKFVERIWEWREEYGGIILDQLRQLGCSCDWSRTRFTLDAGLSTAVRTVFKRLYDEGLLYKGSYLVNWCPKDQTALSDDEVEYKEVKGHLWHIRYPLEDGSGHITVATTRPETMLGDTAVAFNPEDERYAALKGKNCVLPLLDRKIPFITDGHIDREFGTGLVKVTPAHDPNDYDMGKRHELEFINILNPDGTLNGNAGAYEGLSVRDARKKIVADLDALGLLEKIEDHVHQVGHSYRSHAVVEPYISEQWFVSMKPLVKDAIAAVEDGRTRFVPKSWENTYFHWMRNVRDWCVSRQLWWGHQIPAWTCSDCEHVTVTEQEKIDKCEKCGSANIIQDEDVLDTWFSSALWPFSTLGWPEKTQDLKDFYPTATLLTAHEIIFFWVARMIIMGQKFMGDIPFSDVYIHPMVFDLKTKKKMSKSLGNIIDPLEMIEKYGTDAVRITVCAYAVKGANLYLDKERFEGYQNFMNKLWNSARFVLMNTEDLTSEHLAEGLDPETLEIEDRWILGELSGLIEKIDTSLGNYEFDQYVHQLYHFVWGEYCGWYLELVKSRLYSEEPGDATSRRAAQKTLLTVLESILRLMHPAAPFITEEIWQRVRENGAGLAPGQANGLGDSFAKESIMVAPWPEKEIFCPFVLPFEEKRLFDGLKGIIGNIRTLRSEMVMPPKDRPEIHLSILAENDRIDLQFMKEHQHLIINMAVVGKLVFHDGADRDYKLGFRSTGVSGAITIEIIIPESMIEADLDNRVKALEKEGILRDKYRKKLSNPSFAERAPEKIVNAERKKLAQSEQKCEILRKELEIMKKKIKELE